MRIALIIAVRSFRFFAVFAVFALTNPALKPGDNQLPLNE